MAIAAPHDLDRRVAARPVDVRHLVPTLVELADGLEPLVDVAAPVRARQPDVLTHRDRDAPARAAQLVGDLHARGGRTHDEHVSVGRELRRVAVVERGELLDPVRHAGCERRHPRLARCAGRGDQRVARPVPAVGRDVETLSARAHTLDSHVGAHRRRDHVPVVVEQRHDATRAHEPVGVAAVVRESGERGHPVGSEQPQRVPALGAPRVRDLASFQHHVIDAGPAELRARREPRRTGSYDHHRHVHRRTTPSRNSLAQLPRATPSTGTRVRVPGGSVSSARAQASVTRTVVGFVTVSNTADRFCAWASSASRSARDASASMS